MLQSKLNSASLNPVGSQPQVGRRIRDYELRDAEGRVVEFSDFRGQRNLAILFAGHRENGESLAARILPFESELIEDDAKVLVIVADGPAWVSGSESVLILSDPASEAHHDVGAKEPVLFITDRFGEVFARLEGQELEGTRGPAELLTWLDFINAQCPECEPPEMPA